MSVLKTNPNPLFTHKWDVHAQGWGQGILDLNRDAVELLCLELIKVFETDEWWDKYLDQCSCAHWVYNKHVPEKYWEMTDELNRRLVEEIHKIDPFISHIMIEYSTGVQGAELHIPSIELHLDRKWFGYDSTRADVGPNWGRFYSTGKIIITYDRRKLQGYQSSLPDARPQPRFPEFFPDFNEWRKPDRFESTKGYSKYWFFPEGETGRR